MKILVIPGIGDMHWVLLKLESFIEKHCPGEKPEVWVWNFDERPRSGDFIKRIPFVKFGGYLNEPIGMDKNSFEKSYMTGDANYAKISEFHGFDYYLCVNGILRVGLPWNSVLPFYKTNWNYDINLEGCKSPVEGKYIIFYFSDHGMFKKNWTGHLDASKTAKLLDRMSDWGYKLILTGSSWDKPYNDKIVGYSESGKLINMCGDTSLDELLGLIKGASAFVGWCGGNTIISQHMNTPTLMIWSRYFKREFQTNWVDPLRINKVYIPMNVENLNPQDFYKNLGDLIGRKT